MDMVIEMIGIYIHIPFCLRKCPYCAFYSIPFTEKRKQKYVEAVIRNIHSYGSRNLTADTVYFGGGTPSLLSAVDIKRILSAANDSFRLSKDSEITIEANPSSVSPQKLSGYREAGVNRISFGVQSTVDEELRLLGRLHDFSGAQKAVGMARLAGFENISCDLMIGTPAQTVPSLLYSAEAIAALDPTHISCYMLKIENGTPYDCERVKKAAADDDLSADMYLALCRRLADLGYYRYEISNFSRPGYESRHNLKYWSLDDYIGIGASAHSYFEGRRFYVPDSIDDFIASPLQPILIEDDSPDALEEYIMLSLRLASGLSIEKIAALGGNGGAVLKAIEPYVKAGLISCCGANISLTDSGALVSNTLIVEIYMAAISKNR